MILVDPQDEWLLDEFTWYVDELGYVLTNIPDGYYRQRIVRLHHYIAGQPIDGCVIDHIDRDPSNNQRSNLRYATRSENAINSHRSDNALYIRVTRNDKFEVRITRNGVTIQVGTFGQFEDAVRARDEALEVIQ